MSQTHNSIMPRKSTSSKSYKKQLMFDFNSDSESDNETKTNINTNKINDYESDDEPLTSLVTQTQDDSDYESDNEFKQSSKTKKRITKSKVAPSNNKESEESEDKESETKTALDEFNDCYDEFNEQLIVIETRINDLVTEHKKLKKLKKNLDKMLTKVKKDSKKKKIRGKRNESETQVPDKFLQLFDMDDDEVLMTKSEVSKLFHQTLKDRGLKVGHTTTLDKETAKILGCGLKKNDTLTGIGDHSRIISQIYNEYNEQLIKMSD